MTYALLCPGPGPVTLVFMLLVLAAVPLAAGAAVGLAIGAVIKAVRRLRLR